MSYYVSSYLTDADKIKSVFSSKSILVFEQLKAKLNDELEDLNNNFESELEGQQKSQEILQDIINGEIRFPNLNFLYGYVYISLCETFGEQFFTDADDVPARYFWLVAPENSAFITIPFSDDFPQIVSIAKEDLIAQKKFFFDTQHNPNHKNEYPEDIEAFEQIFDTAIKANKDLVLACF
jgi:hypothetical protein